MSSRTLYVKTLDEATDLIRSFSERKEEVLTEAMVGALVNSPFLDDVWRRTPKSERARYAEMMGLKVNWSNRAQIESRWKDKILGDESVSPATALDRYKRLEAYGNSNLAKSIQPWGQKRSAHDLESHVSHSNGIVSFSLWSNLPYARRVHESEVPASNVWRPGQKRGWSVRGTSGHFLYGTPDSPVEKYRRRLMAEIGRNILTHHIWED